MNAKLDGEFREFMHARWPVMVRLAYGWVIGNQPDGTTTKVWPVTVGGILRLRGG